MTEPWRCFIAVPVGESLRKEFATMVAAIRDDSAAAELRWTDPASWHLTIAFLGARPSDGVDRVAAMMRRATGTMETFTVRTGGLGAFLRLRRRVSSGTESMTTTAPWAPWLN
jgi:2'-5' RNA ligase